MVNWQTVVGMLQVYPPSIGLFFVGGVIGHGIANRLGFSLCADWTRWMTTLYLFSLLIPLPLWVEGSLFYENLWLVYALLSLTIGMARGLAFPKREEQRRRTLERLRRARESVEQSMEQQQNEKKSLLSRSSSLHAGTQGGDV